MRIYLLLPLVGILLCCRRSAVKRPTASARLAHQVGRATGRRLHRRRSPPAGAAARPPATPPAWPRAARPAGAAASSPAASSTATPGSGPTPASRSSTSTPPATGIAPLSATSNTEGYFDITGLEPGRTYRLVARVQEGRRRARRLAPASCRPTPRADLPDRRAARGRQHRRPRHDGHPGPRPPRSGRPGGPGRAAATIGTPIHNPRRGRHDPARPARPTPPAVSTTDPTHIAQDKEKKAAGRLPTKAAAR